MRLNQFLARAGVASRRGADELIRAGRVTVNGDAGELHTAVQGGDVVYVDLPETGTEVTAGQAFGEVESTKSVSDVYAPATGTVVERNAALEEKPELVNEQPYGDGWLVAIEMTDPAELDRLLDSGGYRDHVGGS